MEKTYTIFAKGFPKTSLFVRKGIYSPDKYIFLKTITCESSKIKEVSERVFDEEMSELWQSSMTQKYICSGDVVTHSDGKGKTHRGVILEIKNDKAFLILCTTNKYWNDKARLATEEEKALLGFKSTTYIVPTKRSLRNLFKIGYSFPEYRIKDLIEEFKDVNG